jgi:RecA/RadA recombinase
MNKHIVKHIVCVHQTNQYPSKSGLMNKRIVKTYRETMRKHIVKHNMRLESVSFLVPCTRPRYEAALRSGVD